MKLISGIKTEPFTRTQWVSDKARDYWHPRMRRAAAVAYRAERQTVVEGLRAACTVHLPNLSPFEQVQAYQDQGLVLRALRYTRPYQGFAHAHPEGSRDDPDGTVYAVVARDVDTLDRFAKADAEGDHETIGELLGFPSCCQRFFRDVWCSGFVDPVFQSAERTDGVEKVSVSRSQGGRRIRVEGWPEVTSALRYIGARVMFHLPCSMDCEATLERARAHWLPTMEGIDEDATKDLLRVLSLPTLWSCLHGVAMVTTPLFRIVTNSNPCHPVHEVEWVPKGGVPDDIPFAAPGLGFPFQVE